ALDHSFDLDGKIELSMGEPGFWQSAKGVAIQNDGKIVITGYTENFDTTKQYIEVHFLLLRINPDGTLDHSFSDHGVAITPIGKDDGSTSVVILSNGKILQLGNVNFELGDSSDMCLVQY
ncbi:delta-60 repeat domain-containing protein, partial [Escherichia coli]|uniref:delta-60 repeat domain-containing protein n=2 Tax=Pseudomonadati TaxID=3379134 RepID=UPI002119A087